MHVADLNLFLQSVVAILAGAFGLVYLVRSTASRYFMVDSNFDSSAADFTAVDRRKSETCGGEVLDSCAVCGLGTKKQCAACKMVKYCSEACQISHWSSEHKRKCKDLQSVYKANNIKSTSMRGKKASLVRSNGSSKIIKQSNKILFPYEEFIGLFNSDKLSYPPCGLLNCGNSCFANVVLQCLAYTRPLIAYLLEKGHRIECQRDEWCFLCELQNHVERASVSLKPFSPLNILSRLPNIGGNLGHGKQEDAHEFMRFAIDTMQSVCLDEFGGEKVVHPIYQETTLIQHIFGGRLQSQVICTECNNVSNQFENMMDLTVEIHGDAGSLEECLDQFTAKEQLHGENMYKCDSCNAYVMAWKRLTIQRAPNILTVALKRFQSGRFGKLNKRVTFPETLDLRPYMSEQEDGNDVYKLYAVVVHVDMLNASYFGHYICYVKDFSGNWYRIDDHKVAKVDLDEVLSQGAYMLLYSRVCARPSCLLPANLVTKEDSENIETKLDPTLEQPSACSSDTVSVDIPIDSEQSSTANCSGFKVNSTEELLSPTDSEGSTEDLKTVSSDDLNSPITVNVELDGHDFEPSSSISDGIKIDFNCDVSDITVTNGDRQNDLKSPNSTSMTENGGFDNGLSSSGIKSNGEISTAKVKPLFAPGFLVKTPRKKCIGPEIKSHPSNQKDDANFSLQRENVGFSKGDKSYVVRENGQAFMESDLCKSLENGYQHTESDACKRLENGDSGDQSHNIMNEKMQLGIKSPVFDNTSHE